MKLLFVCIVLVVSGLQQANGSCLSYGHSCWGAHGKRSGNSALSTFDNQVTGNIISDNGIGGHTNGVLHGNEIPPRTDHLSLTERIALYKICFLQRRDALVPSANSPNELQDAHNFRLSVADVQAIRQEIEQQLEQQQEINKREFSAQLGKYTDEGGDDDEVMIDSAADADAEGVAKKVRLFRELSPAMRRFLLARSN